METTTAPSLFLSDAKLITHCRNAGTPLPFGLSSLQKDRIDARLGGVPFRRIGGKAVYFPPEVFAFLAGQPIIQAVRSDINIKPRPRPGRPTKASQVAKARSTSSSAVGV